MEVLATPPTRYVYRKRQYQPTLQVLIAIPNLQIQESLQDSFLARRNGLEPSHIPHHSSTAASPSGSGPSAPTHPNPTNTAARNRKNPVQLHTL